MILNLKIVRVNTNYCDYLRRFDNRIPYNRNKKELKYQRLLRQQLSWLNENYYDVKRKSYKLYQLYNEERLPKNVRDRCCNFKLLEEKCLDYTN